MVNSVITYEIHRKVLIPLMEIDISAINNMFSEKPVTRDKLTTSVIVVCLCAGVTNSGDSFLFNCQWCALISLLLLRIINIFNIISQNSFFLSGAGKVLFFYGQTESVPSW